MKNKQVSNWLYGIGVAIVLLTHLYVLFLNIPAEMIAAHSVLNIVAAGLLIGGWGMK